MECLLVTGLVLEMMYLTVVELESLRYYQLVVEQVGLEDFDDKYMYHSLCYPSGNHPDSAWRTWV
jgi:hypothetical protein